jgi:hypothetical protein
MSKEKENLLIALGLFGLYWWFTNPPVSTSVVIPQQVAPILQQQATGVPNTVPANLIPPGPVGGSTGPTITTPSGAVITEVSAAGGAGDPNVNAFADQNPDQSFDDGADLI